MSTIPSEALSSCKSLESCSVVNHRIIDFDQGRYRRQIEYFEYYWGMEQGELDLSSPLNHIQLREDMVEALDNLEWVMIPTKETLDAIYEMAKYNKTADIQSIKHFLKVSYPLIIEHLELTSPQEFPEGEYEYDFVPLFYLKHRNTLYVDHGTSIKAYRTPYRTLPRLRSRAHPFFVIFFADNQLDMCCATVMPEKKARTLKSSIGRIIRCWTNQPPLHFLLGDEANWEAHRHPLSDDGHAAYLSLVQESSENTTQVPKLAAVSPKPYARLDPRSAKERGSALPRPELLNGDDDDGYNSCCELSTIRAWLAKVLSTHDLNCPLPDDNSHGDDILTLYRREAAKDAKDALNPRLNAMTPSSLLYYGTDMDHAHWASNNWAVHVCDTRLMGSDPRR
ncbi:hypothetical protein K523DRAFT_375988 [Schizophyllum commune Tattone D]|nr:hypothetical protein K523DRAFT_375988 [Schizophyllum commune Tattone D]